MTTFGACRKHPNFPMVNCPACQSEAPIAPPTPVSVEEAAKKYADSKADLKWNKASELEAAFLAGHAHRGPTPTVDK